MYRLAASALLCAALAAVAPTTSVAVSDTPLRSTTFDGPVYAVLYHGSTVYVGGDFANAIATDSDGTETTTARQNLAAIDLATGQLVSGWNPRANDTVRALAASGGRLYLGGDFTRVNGVRRTRVAAVSAISASSRGDRLVEAFRHRADGAVNALAARGRWLYIGGDFTAVDGRARRRLAAFNLRTSAIRRWQPNVNSSVLALEATKTRVYIAGEFRLVNGKPGHAYLAAVESRRSRVVQAFDPRTRYPFHDVAVTPTAVYGAGDGPGGHLHKVSLGGATRWVVATNGAVQAVGVLGDRVYAGGHFTEVCHTTRVRASGECAAGGNARGKVFAVGGGGRLLSWSPNLTPENNYGVRTLDVHAGRDLVGVGGHFNTVDGVVVKRFTQF